MGFLCVYTKLSNGLLLRGVSSVEISDLYGRVFFSFVFFSFFFFGFFLFGFVHFSSRAAFFGLAWPVQIHILYMLCTRTADELPSPKKIYHNIIRYYSIANIMVAVSGGRTGFVRA